jgi:hypothetical protein
MSAFDFNTFARKIPTNRSGCPKSFNGSIIVDSPNDDTPEGKAMRDNEARRKMGIPLDPRNEEIEKRCREVIRQRAMADRLKKVSSPPKPVPMTSHRGEKGDFYKSLETLGLGFVDRLALDELMKCDDFVSYVKRSTHFC